MRYSSALTLLTAILAVNTTAQTTIPPVLIADLEGAKAVKGPLKVSSATKALLFVTRTEIATSKYVEDLWRSDGSTAGTIKAVSRLSYEWTTDLVDVSDTYFYYTRTSAGEQQLKWNALSGISNRSLTAPSTSGSGFVFNDKFIAAITDTQTGRELYSVDPSTGTAVLLRDINPEGNSTVSPGCILGQKVLFIANDGRKGTEPWVTDGTSSGTIMLKDLCTGATGSSPGDLTPIGNKVYFSAMNASGNREPWVTNGTTNGTYMIKDINPSTSAGSMPRDFTEFGGKVYFSADNGGNGRELWVTDGTSAGTTMVSDLVFPGDGSPHDLTVHNRRLWFFARNALSAVESLYSTDGTSAGTKVQVSLPQNNFGSNLVSCNGKVFYCTNASGSSRLWRTDGRTAGTSYVAPPIAANAQPIPGVRPVVINDWLHFIANFEGTGMKLWKVQ